MLFIPRAAVFGVVARAADVTTYEVLISRDSEHAAADGVLEFEQVAMTEGVQCWHDRADYHYQDVPESLIPGTLLRGNHKVGLQLHTIKFSTGQLTVARCSAGNHSRRRREQC